MYIRVYVCVSVSVSVSVCVCVRVGSRLARRRRLLHSGNSERSSERGAHGDQWCYQAAPRVGHGRPEG
jgi:hypothetical protein